MEKLSESTEKKGDFCFLANIKTYLNSFHQYYEEYWLAGIIGVTGFYFTTVLTGVPSVINGRSKEFEGLYEDFTEYLLEPLQVEYFSDKDSALSRIDQLLKTDVIPMMWMDEYYIPEAYNYQKNHLWVMAVILESNDKELLIFSNEEIRIIKSGMDGMIYRDDRIELQYTRSARIEWKYSELEMVVKGIHRVIHNLCKNIEVDQEYNGLAGMRHFLTVFRECRNDQVIYNYFYEMNRGGGLYKTRRNMKLFFREVKQRWDCGKAEKCSLIYQELEEKWTKITNLIYKLSICKDLGLQQRIVNRIEEVILLEEQGIREMQILLCTLSKKNKEE